MRTQRVLPADVYDTIEFSALAFGGIGGSFLLEGVGDDAVPYCAWGHAIRAEVPDIDTMPNLFKRACEFFPLSIADNDSAVQRINARKGVRERNARVTFAEWAKELNIVRGE